MPFLSRLTTNLISPFPLYVVNVISISGALWEMRKGFVDRRQMPDTFPTIICVFYLQTDTDLSLTTKHRWAFSISLWLLCGFYCFSPFNILMKSEFSWELLEELQQYFSSAHYTWPISILSSLINYFLTAEDASLQTKIKWRDTYVFQISNRDANLEKCGLDRFLVKRTHSQGIYTSYCMCQQLKRCEKVSDNEENVSFRKGINV